MSFTRPVVLVYIHVSRNVFFLSQTNLCNCVCRLVKPTEKNICWRWS